MKSRHNPKDKKKYVKGSILLIFVLALSVVGLEKSGLILNMNNENMEMGTTLKEIENQIPEVSQSDFPIEIYDNERLVEFCQANGSGSGTAADPYIIEDFHIFDNEGDGINIRNTDKNLIIRNCTIKTMDDDISTAGIEIKNASYVNISNNHLENNYYGIRLTNTNHSLISGNNCSNNYRIGISSIEGSENNTIIENIFSENDHGISLGEVNNHTIKNNNCTENNQGIYLGGASYKVKGATNNLLWGNNCSFNEIFGINIREKANHNFLKNNFMENSGIVSKGNNNSIDTSNKVNGESVRYYEDEDGIELSGISDAGQILLVNTSNSLVENVNVTETAYGIYLYNATNNTIKKNNCSLNLLEGIRIRSSDNNTIVQNNLTLNEQEGIYLLESMNNTLLENRVSLNGKDGIDIDDSLNCTATRNYIKSNLDDGLSLSGSHNITIEDNTFESNEDDGCYLYFSDENEISNNTFSGHEDGTQITFYSDRNSILNNTFTNCEQSAIKIVDWSDQTTLKENSMFDTGIIIKDSYESDIDESNVVNGKAVHFFEEQTQIHLDFTDGPGIGQVIAVKCTQSIFEDFRVFDTSSGIYFTESHNNTLSNVTCTENNNGIYFHESSNNTLSESNCSGNEVNGILMESNSEGNLIWNNTFSENGLYQAYCDSSSSENSWDNGEIGNLWGDYESRYPTATNDGTVWSQEYIINGTTSVSDSYPLFSDGLDTTDDSGDSDDSETDGTGDDDSGGDTGTDNGTDNGNGTDPNEGSFAWYWILLIVVITVASGYFVIKKYQQKS